MKLQHRWKSMRGKPGQVWPLFAIMLPVFLGVAGLTIDLGFAYLAKTTLSKAIDAAALAAMKNLSLGQSQAQTMAQNAFNANYGANPPPVSIVFTKDASNNMLV